MNGREPPHRSTLALLKCDNFSAFSASVPLCNPSCSRAVALSSSFSLGHSNRTGSTTPDVLKKPGAHIKLLPFLRCDLNRPALELDKPCDAWLRAAR
jgi:hypothetical protein